MIDSIYLERSAADHPRSREILRRYPKARVIECDSYRQIFNRRQQNFRVQKSRPALLLALKSTPRLHPVPGEQHLGAPHNYYFSHLLNCPFDCRYCFLQGMFSSANYVLFVNYDAFLDDIRTSAAGCDGPVHFFSGYDCDSLALEPLTGFAAHFVAPFANIANAVLELRTKSTQIRSLLAQTPHANCVTAMSLAPDRVIKALEHGTPGLDERLQALARLAEHGWPIGLRFDPLIPFAGARAAYRDFFGQVFSMLDAGTVHSVTLGGLRLPREFAKRMTRIYPDEALFALAYDEQGGVQTAAGSAALIRDAAAEIERHVPAGRVFIQQDTEPATPVKPA